MKCQSRDEIFDNLIDRIATQYRESPRLIALIKAYVMEAAKASEVACHMLDYFDIDTAVGDQLTILGKALGWPRDHCIGQRRPVFGFACDNECFIPSMLVGGFCEADWNCGQGPDMVTFTFTDDELYRRFLKSRVITLTHDYTREALAEAAVVLFGDFATIWREVPGSSSVVTGRLLTDIEISIAHLYPQVMPIPPGIGLDIYHCDGPAFGFGGGWGGICDGHWPVKVTIN